MDVAEAGQISTEAAEVDERLFVPALFGQFAPPSPRLPGRIPDRGRSTKPAAPGSSRERCSGGRRRVDGPRASTATQACSRLPDGRNPPSTAEGKAEALSFQDRHFDAVVSQFGPMYFEDRIAALREMWRVPGSGGCMVVAVWDCCTTSPEFCGAGGAVRPTARRTGAASLRAPFVLVDWVELAAMFGAVGFRGRRHGGDKARDRALPLNRGAGSGPKSRGLECSRDQVDEDSRQCGSGPAKDELTRDFCSARLRRWPSTVAAHSVFAQKPL